jgi:hypothetical protein
MFRCHRGTEFTEKRKGVKKERWRKGRNEDGKIEETVKRRRGESVKRRIPRFSDSSKISPSSPFLLPYTKLCVLCG